MKNKRPRINRPLPSQTDDITSPDNDADKTGTDVSSDSTEERNDTHRFDKPKREVHPDRTGIDVNSDKTKRSN